MLATEFSRSFIGPKSAKEPREEVACLTSVGRWVVYLRKFESN